MTKSYMYVECAPCKLQSRATCPFQLNAVSENLRGLSPKQLPAVEGFVLGGCSGEADPSPCGKRGGPWPCSEVLRL